ncbi:hypothetical protein PHLCEN_2v10703 [Hermanssonia centrifuga]|uniref:Uncharacterized protein n=1 Tax=Hermanssonia centrifuga TaxID=98765 RepID=A0A2R6NM13_9APHY|nr:hypothetical protein PHLCEN_2v10703 [Hermanssonia centrifuga]
MSAPSFKTPNGPTPGISGVSLEVPTNNSGMYAPGVKDPSQIKSPHLPFGENVTVATNANVL